MKKRTVIFLDFDGVIVVGWSKRKGFPWGYHDPLDRKCVKVLNEIYDEIPYDVVVSSDWRCHFTIDELRQIFNEFKVKAEIIGVTEHSRNYTGSNLEGGRVEEIELYVEQHQDEILAWVSVDDLKMYDLEHFVECPKWTEGIKQTGIKEKVIQELKSQIDE